MTKIEKIRPEITSLVEKIGGSLYYRASEWWLSPWDKQLTYKQDNRVSPPRLLDLAGRALLAVELLNRILMAREQPAWGTVQERVKRIITGLTLETLPNYIPRNYCYFRHASMDQGCILKSRFGSEWFVWIEIIGKPMVEQHRENPLEAINAAGQIFGICS